MRAKVSLNKNFGIKARYIRNNNGLPILPLELWRKTKQWHKKYEKYQFFTQSPEALYKKLFFKIS